MATALFSPEQIAALAAPLDRAKVQTRSQAGRSLAYLEGWQAIAEANRIFGFDGWQRETVALRCVSQSERTIGRDNRPGWGVTYTARVRIRVGNVMREGSGAGHGIDVDLGQAHESALKEAETDAMKRALMTFGNPFGLALYDKQQREVSGGAEPGKRPSSRPLRVVSPATSRPLPSQEPNAGATSKTEPPTAEATAQATDPGLAPLDPATIHQLCNTIRSLPRPALEGFTKAFRKRFQVPAEAPSIADRICQRRHQDWIEAFLVQHQGSMSAEIVAQTG
jgi:DNA recombination protein Rad52